MVNDSESPKSEDLSDEGKVIDRLRAREEQRFLRQSGLPAPRWDSTVPGHFLENPDFLYWWDHVDDRYEAGDNYVITNGTRETRMQIAAAMAMRVRGAQNPYPREAFGYKHHSDSIHPGTGELVTWPYTFQFMDVSTLEKFRKERDLAVKWDDDGIEETWEQAIIRPDFFFLTEVGHEWPTTWNAKLIEDLLYARGDQAIPTILTLARPISKLQDKHEVKVYETVAEFIRGWKGVGL